MSESLTLRDVDERDLPVFFEHQCDARAIRMAAFPSRDRKTFREHWDRSGRDEDCVRQTILVDDQVAGYVACFARSGLRLVGYWLGREFWGRGLATRALTAFLEQVTTRPLHAYVARRNRASIRVLEKCGFTIAGESTTSDGPGGEPVEEYLMQLG